MDKFKCSERVVMTTKQLSFGNGVLSTRILKTRNAILQTKLELVQDFYKHDDVSRNNAWDKNCISLKVGESRKQ